VKLAGEQLVLDTNILVHLLRGKQAGRVIERLYGIGQRTCSPSITSPQHDPTDSCFLVRHSHKKCQVSS
jgi:hypothetical protein